METGHAVEPVGGQCQRHPGQVRTRELEEALAVLDRYFRTKLLGCVEPELRVVPQIERTARGKRRLMIQHIKAEEGARAA